MSCYIIYIVNGELEELWGTGGYFCLSTPPFLAHPLFSLIFCCRPLQNLRVAISQIQGISPFFVFCKIVFSFSSRYNPLAFVKEK